MRLFRGLLRVTGEYFDNSLRVWYNGGMYGIYAEIIGAAERAAEPFAETEQLLEYPEVQADKAYYLSVLSQYNALKSIKDKLTALKTALSEASELTHVLSGCKDEDEREAFYAEITALKRETSALAAALSDALGHRHVAERAYCRFKWTAAAAKLGVQLYGLIKDDLLSRGAKVEGEKSEYARAGHIRGISFFAAGEDVVARLFPLTGAHKVYLANAGSEELCFAVTPAAEAVEISEGDLKIDVFHASGAGGQNVNKVETAVRVTHLPTGLTVTCQDERSQLQNRKRAVETIKRRLREEGEEAEKKRVEADISAQFRKKNTPVSFRLANSTMTDTRLKGFTDVAFPLTDFSSYLNRLI